MVEQGHAVGITTASDDTTNPPAMAQYWHRTVKGSVLMEFAKGWGHMHVVLPESNVERIWTFLLTGVDPK